MRDPDQLDPDLRVLFDAVKTHDEIDAAFDDAARERMLSRVERVAHGPSSAGRGFFGRRGVIIVSVGLLAILAASRFPSERRTAAPTSPTPSATQLPSGSAAVVPVLSVDDLPSSAPPPATSAPAVAVSTASARAPGSGLAEEYRLVEGARAKLAAKDYAGALQSIRAHEARFPRGQLNQECESLHIQLLVETGRIEEARERANGFRARFPNGLLLPSVAHAIATDPGMAP